MPISTFLIVFVCLLEGIEATQHSCILSLLSFAFVILESVIAINHLTHTHTHKLTHSPSLTVSLSHTHAHTNAILMVAELRSIRTKISGQLPVEFGNVANLGEQNSADESFRSSFLVELLSDGVIVLTSSLSLLCFPHSHLFFCCCTQTHTQTHVVTRFHRDSGDCREPFYRSFAIFPC